MMTEDREVNEIFWASLLISIVGVGYLFPFSALTQPVDFWTYVFPDFNIEFPLTTLYMWINLIFLALIVFAGRKPSYTFRIVGGFIGQAMVLVIVPSLYFLHLDEYTYYICIMLATAFAAVVTALVDSVAIGFAAHYPLRVQEGLQFGIGLSTLIGSVYRILTKLVFPADQVVFSSSIYFYAGAATILFCIATYYRLLAMNISKRYFFAHQQQASLTKSYGAIDGSELTTYHHDNGSHDTERGHLIVSPISDLDSLADSTIAPSLLQSIAWNEFLVFLLFSSTLLCWPGLVTEIPSYNFPALQESRWWSLLLLLLFSSFDCIGRLLTPYRIGLTPDSIHVPILMRLCLIPLCICSTKGYYLTHDAFSVLIVGALGFSNGYVGSLAVMMVSEVVKPEDRGIAGSYTGFFLNLGLVLGATAAMGLKAYLDSW